MACTITFNASRLLQVESSRQRFGSTVSGSRLTSLRIRAVQGTEGPRRLVDIIRIVPELSRSYFQSPSRRALYGGISLLGGFYVAQTISLSFGALAVNDVIAAVVCVLLTEYVTKFYYSRPKENQKPKEEGEKKRGVVEYHRKKHGEDGEAYSRR